MEIVYKTEIKKYQIKVADVESVGLCQPSTVFQCLKDDFNPLQEEFYVLCMDSKNKLIEKKLIFKGTLASVNIFISDILRSVLMSTGNRFIVAHNHPSGDSTPSTEDLDITRKLGNATRLIGLELLDHIVYTDKSFTSIREKINF